MRTVKVKKKELMTKLVANKEKHIKDFEEAVSDYKELVLSICQSNLKLSKTGSLDSFDKIKAIPGAPREYTKEYERAISMLEMSVDDVIELEDDVFNQLVLDEWNWKNQFVMATTSYKAALSGGR